LKLPTSGRTETLCISGGANNDGDVDGDEIGLGES